MFDGFDDSQELSRELVAFDEWCEVHGTEDVEAFICEGELGSAVSMRLRNTFALERKLNALFVDSRNDEEISPTRASDLAGKVFGNYRFVCRLGVGGMGTVWLANQQEPVKRQVAVKLIRPGMDSELFVKRFEAERQAMALMSHPNIAKVLDAGTVGDHRPYFVMEYVPGVPITDFCNQNRLSLLDRLKLFLQLCNAIQHAHQKGLLHRDIKPTNVMVSEVDGKPHVKVIDFGLSKLFSTSAGMDPQLTQEKTALGSPLWMSPEQAMGRRGKTDIGVDTRSDIYSLGVILYQLITNTTPITTEFFSNASPIELLEAIQEQVTPYPSIRLSQTEHSNDWIRQQTISSFANWSNMLRNDLDWVTMKALEKERDRRYPTASALADDIRRFINKEPVIARPPSISYRIRKLALKYRGAALATSLITFLLIAATVISAWLAIWALDERKVANQERTRANRETLRVSQKRLRAEQIVGYMVRGFGKLNISNPDINYDQFKQDYLFSLRDDIDQVDFSGDALMESSFRYPLARSLSGAGDHENAINEFEKVVAINRRELGANDPLTIATKTLMASEYLQLQNTTKAFELAEECLADATATHGQNHELCIGAAVVLNRARAELGELNVSIGEFKKLIPVATESLGSSHPHVIDAKAGLASALYNTLRFRASAAIYNDARQLAIKRWGTDHKRSMDLEVAYWDAKTSDADFQESPEELKAYFEAVAKKFGPGHRFTLQLRDIYGTILLRRKNREAAKLIHLASIEAGTKQLGESHFQVAMSKLRLCDVLFSQRKLDEAIQYLDSIIPILESNPNIGAQKFLRAGFMLGECYFYKGDYQGALNVTEEYLPIALEVCGPDAIVLARLLDLNARSLMECERPVEAIAAFERILQDTKDRDGDGSVLAGQAYFRLAFARLLNREFAEAIQGFEKTVEIFKKQVGMQSYDTYGITTELCSALLWQKKYKRAEFHIRHSIENLSPQMPGYEDFKDSFQVALADSLVGQSIFFEAKTTVEKVMDVNSQLRKRDRALAKSIMGLCLAQEGDFAKAELLLDEALELLDPESLKYQDRWYRTRCLERKITLYKYWEKPDLVKDCREALQSELEYQKLK